MAGRWVWWLAALCGVLTAVDTLLVTTRFPLFSEESIGIHGWPFVNVASFGCSAMGALIVSTLRRHRVGWLLLFLGLTTATSLVCETYSLGAVDDGRADALATQVTGFVAALLGGPLALAMLAVIFILLPDGRVLSRAWRWPVLFSVLGYLVFAVGIALTDPAVVMESGDPPDNGGASDILLSGGVLVIAVTLVSGVVAMVIRFRRSDARTRRQLRPVAFGAAAVAAALVVLLVGQAINGGQQSAVTSIPLFATYLVLLMTVALAVLRYGMYDLDVIVSRAVLVTAATLFAAAGYVIVVVAVGGALGTREQGFWRSLIATVVVALAFQPLRRRIVRLADRLAYGDRAAPYEALAQFSREVGIRPDPHTLLPAVAEASARASRADVVVARLEFESAPPHLGWWPPRDRPPEPVRAAHVVAVPVADEAGALGSITLGFEHSGAAGDPERSLMTGIAAQAALAFRNARLELQLAGQVAALADQTRNLEASRRRLIDAADRERERLEEAISRDVLPILSQVRADIASSGRPVDPAEVTRLIDDTTRALEALRELTRGIFPTVLPRSGLGAALSAHVARAHPGTAFDASALGPARFDPRVEAAAYYCAVEALRGASGTPSLTVAVRGDTLVVEVHGDDPATLDERAVEDRLAACGGTLTHPGDDDSRIRFTIPIETVKTVEAVVTPG